MILSVLTGSNYHTDNFSAVSNGMEVELVHDTENTHSENAVWVIAKGIGIIGHLTEGYIPSGFKTYADDAMKAPDILNGVIRQNKEYKAIIEQKRPNGCLIFIEIIGNDVIDENGDNMNDKWEIGTTEEEFTLVGCGHFVVHKNIGDKVSIGVDNYSIDVDGKIKGTATAFNEDGKAIGLFPQSEKKFSDCIAMGGKYASGDEIKEKYASDTLITDGYVIIDISKCGRYIKLGIEEDTMDIEDIEVTDEVISLVTQLQSTNRGLVEAEEVVEEETDAEEVVNPLNDPQSAYNRMRDVMPDRDWAEDKDGKFLIDKPSEESVVPEYTTPVVKDTESDAECIRLRNKRDELISKANKLRDELKEVENEIDVTTHQLAERTEALDLIKSIEDKLSSMDIEELREIHNKFVSDDTSSNEEDTTSSFDKASEEINQYSSLKDFNEDIVDINTTVGKLCSDIEHMNLETIVNNGFKHKRHLKMSDEEISELNRVLQKKDKELRRK